MYKIVLPNPAYPLPQNPPGSSRGVLEGAGTLLVTSGVARDLLAQLATEPQLRVICPGAPRSSYVVDPVAIDLSQHTGLSFRLLPWSGSTRTWVARMPAVRRVLREEARGADVWHAACSRGLWDVTTMSYAVGRRHAPRDSVRVFCLDSDPAEMLRNSGGAVQKLKAALVRRSLERRVREADVVIFIGPGVQARYGALPKRAMRAEAVWLNDGELADEAATRAKFADPAEPARLVLPTRFQAWKGVDDGIDAIARLRAGGPANAPPPFTLDIMGSGEHEAALVARARAAGLLDGNGRVRFLPPTPYGEPFFQTLRTYHLVLVPTRGLEEARIVYDAAASGCVLVHSDTPTLRAALAELSPRWSYPPADVVAMARTIGEALSRRAEWQAAGLNGLSFMRGRRIQTMHEKRSVFLRDVQRELREARSA
jgi:glycosyltransferase involved in cell wall biosynthesis